MSSPDFFCIKLVRKMCHQIAYKAVRQTLCDIAITNRLFRQCIFIIGIFSIGKQFFICRIRFRQTIITFTFGVWSESGRIINMIYDRDIIFTLIRSFCRCRFRDIKSTICPADDHRDLFPRTNCFSIYRSPEQIPSGSIIRTFQICPCTVIQQTAFSDLLLYFWYHCRIGTLRIDLKASRFICDKI